MTGEKQAGSADSEEAARALCLRLLAGAPRTRVQLERGLARRNVPAEVADRVLDGLAEVGLVDDAAFAAAWVSSRHAGRGLARRALAHELRGCGVADPLVAQAVGELTSEDEEERARSLVERRLAATRGLDPPARVRRLAGLLARRGYPPALAMRVVRDALEHEGVDVGDVDTLASGDDGTGG